MNYRGIVRYGSGKASVLGFPTINIVLADSEPSGIYAGTVSVHDHEYPAAIYADQDRNVLEAHLLDFSGALYDQEVTITLRKKIRDTASFADDATLAAAIQKDIDEVRAHFA